ncbi:MAG: hypothetical protein GY815_04660 [Gammaproteobacteria bacterium]|nr:hypothetical protein [Gammaproteobacteria bacterium]
MTNIRARDLGLDFPGTPGKYNSITDVAGVRVGFSTLTDAARNIRSGVTAIIPRIETDIPQPVRAGKPSMLHRSHLRSGYLDPLYLATVESVEEAVINALVAGKDTPTFKPEGKLCHAIDHAELVDVLRRYGRLTPTDG